MIVLGLGSNIGDRMGFLRAARQELSTFVGDMTCSPVYQTLALLPENAPPEWNIDFYNMALRGETGLTPAALLPAIKAVEQNLGRQDRGRWGPREIDIDILAYDDVIMHAPELVLPHVGLLDRDFALVPFADVAPDWLHPNGEGATMHELAKPHRETLQRVEQGLD